MTGFRTTVVEKACVSTPTTRDSLNVRVMQGLLGVTVNLMVRIYSCNSWTVNIVQRNQWGKKQRYQNFCAKIMEFVLGWMIVSINMYNYILSAWSVNACIHRMAWGSSTSLSHASPLTRNWQNSDTLHSAYNTFYTLIILFIYKKNVRPLSSNYILLVYIKFGHSMKACCNENQKTEIFHN